MNAPGDITLAIETSNPTASSGAGVCVGVLRELPLGTPDLREGGLGVHVHAWAPVADEAAPASASPKTRNEDRLMLAIDQAMIAAGLSPRQIKRIAVSVGPGGFTSVRLAVTAAKCIAEVTGAHCIAVPTALVAAVRHAASTPDSRASFAVALASKGDDAYIQAFAPNPAAANPGAPGDTNASVSPLTEGAVIDAAGLATLARDHAITTLLADGFLPASLREQAASLKVTIVPIALDPVACLAASRHIEPVDPVALLPIYPREPEAVTKWRAMHADKKPR